MLHFSHPQHPLSHINLPHLFTCSGCQEVGAAKRYACRLCNYQLHEFCALAPQALKSHPLHYQHEIVFYSKPGRAKSKCDACGKSVKGFSFRCNACNFQIHPCCAMLPLEVVFKPHPHTLKLLMASPNGGGDTGFQCGECKRRRRGRIYRCAVCDYHLHAICAKIIFNGLLDCGIKEPGKSGNMLEAAAQLALQVVTGFFGGLIEGIGEGVGEDMVQNIMGGTGNAFISRGIAGK
ncbi:Phorbol-ester/DAG-type domain-containing protein [Psidium guajava]|nr:Phorbol-ester/DAG-type domain-containing protein [Psidium guajava]